MTARDKAKAPADLDRRTFLKLSGGAAVALATGMQSKSTAQANKRDRPNILLIITDQQHFDTVAEGGCRYVKTPAMDQLVREGTSFQLSHSTNPLCSPARSSIFTGRTSSETGVYVNGKPIRPSIPNLGQWLGRKAKYETVYAGKWHLPSSYTASIPGFRVLHTGIGGQGNLGDTAVSRACEAFLRKRDTKKPFLLVASFLQPHDICEWLRLNTQVPEALRYPELAGELPPLPKNFEFDPNEPAALKKTRGKNEPAKGNWTKDHWRYYLWSYYRHIEMVDGQIGRILQALRDSRQDGNTLILFTSDHGEGLAHHQMVRKSSPYDEASKVRMILVRPGDIPAGKTDATHLVSGLDVMPTFCDYVGVQPPKDMRGKSLRPLLEGKSTHWHRFVVTEVNGDSGRMLRTLRYKYITYHNDPVDVLFDMKDDPGETRNLAKSPGYATLVAEHRDLLRQWEQQLDVAPNVPNKNAWWRRPDAV